jgi:prophage DNA circulation protein
MIFRTGTKDVTLGQVATISSVVTTHTGDLSTAQSSIQAQAAQISTLEVLVSTANAASASTALAHDASRAVLEDTISTLQQSISGISGLLSSLTSNFQSISGDVSQLQLSSDTTEQTMVSISTSVTGHTTRLNFIDGVTSQLMSSVASQDSRLTTQTLAINELNSLTDSLNSQLGELGPETSNAAMNVAAVLSCAASNMLAKADARSANNPNGCVNGVVPTLPDSSCNSNTLGLLRTNTAKKNLDICDGSQFKSVSQVVCILWMAFRIFTPFIMIYWKHRKAKYTCDIIS